MAQNLSEVNIHSLYWMSTFCVFGFWNQSSNLAAQKFSTKCKHEEVTGDKVSNILATRRTGIRAGDAFTMWKWKVRRELSTCLSTERVEDWSSACFRGIKLEAFQGDKSYSNLNYNFKIFRNLFKYDMLVFLWEQAAISRRTGKMQGLLERTLALGRVLDIMPWAP